MFSDDSWEKRWINSKHKDDFGKWVISHGQFYGDAVKDKGLKTSQVIFPTNPSINSPIFHLFSFFSLLACFEPLS